MSEQDRRLSVASLVNPEGSVDDDGQMANSKDQPVLIDPHDEKVLIAVSALGDMRALQSHPLWDSPRSPGQLNLVCSSPSFDSRLTLPISTYLGRSNSFPFKGIHLFPSHISRHTLSFTRRR